MERYERKERPGKGGTPRKGRIQEKMTPRKGRMQRTGNLQKKGR